MIIRISRYWCLNVGWLKKADRFVDCYRDWYDGPHYVLGCWFFVVAISPWEGD